MKKLIVSTLLVSLLGGIQFCFAQDKTNDYLVIAGKTVKADSEWNKIATELSDKHQKAQILYYDQHPSELLKDIQKINPRYVAIVEKPENLAKDYVVNLNIFSRNIDSDIYADFMWGIITGYDAAAAMKMVKNSTEPLVIKSCVSTVMETADGKWFEKYGYMDDQNMGVYGYKMPGDKTVKREATTKTVPATRGTKQVPDLLPLFYEMYPKIDPDLVITASHASQKALEMPFSAGFIKPQDGVLYAQLPDGNKNLIESGKRKVYLPIGNCLIGDVDSTKNSMAIAWMNSGNAATFVGYVVSTWHGRAGWGGLKYFLTTPGRYTVAESFFLNQQDMLYQMNKWYPELNNVPYGFHEKSSKGATEKLEEILKHKPTSDEHGFWHDRDVIAYYGDPKWDARLMDMPQERDFTVTSTIKDKKCTITVKTGLNFSPRLMAGDYFKQVHVLDLPFSYVFPERLNNPRLAEGQKWKVAVDENFLLVYNNRFGPNNTYEIVLDID